jgi:hypothetical protein
VNGIVPKIEIPGVPKVSDLVPQLSALPVSIPGVGGGDGNEWQCKLNVCAGTLEANYWNLSAGMQASECAAPIAQGLQWIGQKMAKCIASKQKSIVDCYPPQNGGKYVLGELKVMPYCKASNQRAVLNIKIEQVPFLPCPSGTSINPTDPSSCVTPNFNSEDILEAGKIIPRELNPLPYIYTITDNLGVTEIIKTALPIGGIDIPQLTNVNYNNVADVLNTANQINNATGGALNPVLNPINSANNTIQNGVNTASNIVNQGQNAINNANEMIIRGTNDVNRVINATTGEVIRTE